MNQAEAQALWDSLSHALTEHARWRAERQMTTKKKEN